MTKAKNELYQMDALLSALQKAGSILLFSHISPDGDTLGSALALKLRLERLEKRVCLVLDGDVPTNLRFLPGVESIMCPDAEVSPEGFSLSVAVDVSCEERLGAGAERFKSAGTTALIDHHATNDGFAAINVIDGDAPATAVLIHRLFEALGGPASRDEAICLYTALSTDTGNFVYESTNAECFRMMGSLMEAGLPLSQYSRMLFRQKERAFVELLGKTLPSLRLSCGGAVAGLTLSLLQMKEAQATAGNTDGVVDYAIDIEGVKLAYFARETAEGRVKVSLRALEPYRVDEAAECFGGGGHRLAAGCTLDLPLEDAARAVEAALHTAAGSVCAL